ncbi:MAG: asparagine synthase-related protein, partial [Flavobacteriales bacterium]
MIPFQTSIIPIKQQFAIREHTEHVLDKKALCVYVTLGFFLEADSFYKYQQVLQPSTIYQLNEQKHVVKQQPYFKWHYSPRKLAFKTALAEFTDLFESIVKEQSLKQPVILPLSGGLDSRTQAVALHHLKAHVQSYSYSFKDGFKEHLIAEQIAKTCGFNFKAFEIPKYEASEGAVAWKGEDLLALEPAERAARGVFLSFQYPIEIPG